MITAVVGDVHFAAVMTSLHTAAATDRAMGDDRRSPSWSPTTSWPA